MFSSSTIFDFVDIFWVFVGALTGALVARRQQYDITGIFGIALASGLGGGLIRDTLLQDGPPLALVNHTYLPTVVVATVAGAFFGGRFDQLKRTILISDAVTLGFFAVAGCLRTFDAGLDAWPAVLLGVTTAVGGGALRDVLMGETPMIFRRGELYALAALIACFAVVICRDLDLPRTVVVTVGIGVGIVIRLGSVKYHWYSWVPR
ncbi:MAG TPA: trimeric intracellular cation channel family protein [Thermomicrobiales bacterium]|nr:trimeric intracellular cation channel family protein [Thermomicrobiales bacterium]